MPKSSIAIGTPTKAEAIPVAFPEGRLDINDQIADKMQLKISPELLAKRGKIF